MIYRNSEQDVDIPDCTFPSAMLRHADRLTDKPAFIEASTGRSIHYSDLKKSVQHAAGGLHEYGVRQREVVTLLAPNSIEFVIAFAAIASLGAVVAPANPLLTQPELACQVEKQGARWVIAADHLADLAETTALHLGLRSPIVIGSHDRLTTIDDLLSHQRLAPSVRIDPQSDIAALLTSSGTTGLPKSVMLTHRSLVSMARLKAGPHEIKETDIVTGQLPLSHAFGIMITLAAGPFGGATSILLPRFDLEDYLRSIQDYRCTRSYAAPPVLILLAKHPMVDRFDLSSLEFILSGAAPLGAEIEAAVRERIGCKIKQGFGMTECVPLLLGPDDAPASKQGSVGLPALNTEVRVVRLDAQIDCAPGEPGEIWARGPQAMAGYLDDPAATDATRDAEGWIHTGDIGYVDEEGYFFIVDRIKELIKYKAHQVAPAELEALLLSHPAVADVAVVRYPDDEAGEIPKAFVVARSPLDPDELMAWVAERVAPYKKVRQVEFIDAIPKSASGKILRRELIERDRAATPVLA